MDIFENRRLNFSNIINELINTKKFKNAVAVFKHYKITPSYGSQLLNKHVNFGEKSARKLEKLLELENGALDKPIDAENSEIILPKLKTYNARYRDIPLIPLNEVCSWKEKVADSELYLDTIVTQYKGENLEDIFCTKVIDLSMFPLFQIGDFLTIDPNLKPKVADYVLAKFGVDQVVLRQYQVSSYDSQGDVVFNLSSLNHSYPTYNSATNPLEIIGVVVVFERRIIDYQG